MVNGVDVTEFVDADSTGATGNGFQLRRCRPPGTTARCGTRSSGSGRTRWSGPTGRPPAALSERVDGEWSFTETLRHLIYITDSWASRTILDEPMPYHRLGLPQTAYAPADAAALGMDLSAQPSLAEVLGVRAGRMAQMRSIVDGLTDAELERMCPRSPAPGYPEEPRSVAECLGVVMEEECEHHRFAVRDLAVLEES